MSVTSRHDLKEKGMDLKTSMVFSFSLLPPRVSIEEHQTPCSGKSVGLWVRCKIGESELRLEDCQTFE